MSAAVRLGTVVLLKLYVGRPLFLEAKRASARQRSPSACPLPLNRKLIRLHAYEGPGCFEQPSTGMELFRTDGASPIPERAEANGLDTSRRQLYHELFSG